MRLYFNSENYKNPWNEISIETAILHGVDPFNLTDLEYATQY